MAVFCKDFDDIGTVDLQADQAALKQEGAVVAPVPFKAVG